MEPLKAIELPIKKIFSSDFTFNVPPYQRPYSWTVDQAHELFDDLHTGVGDHPANVKFEEMPPYFLGSIVLIKKPDRPEAAVVDGQQRLTTLTILLAALRDKAPDDEMGAAIQNLIFQKADPMTGDPDRFRLTLRPRDAKFFRVNIQELGATVRLANDHGELSDSQKNILMNGRELLCRVDELEAAEKRRLASFVIQRCYLVAVATGDSSTAYRIFSVLNDRGLDLSATDILKSEIIGKFQDDPVAEKKHTETWEDLEDDLGRKQFEELFGHIRMISVRQKARRNLVDEFREDVLQKANPRTFIDDILVPYADAYEQVIRPDLVTIDRSEQIKRYLRILRRLDNVDWMPPAIEFIAKNKGKGAEIERFLGALERLAYSLFLRREYPTERITRYGAVLTAMADGNDIYAAGSPLDLSDQEKIETLQQLDGPLYLTPRLRLPVLLRLDELMSAGGVVKYDFDIISVEHVLPQTLSAGSEWSRLFPDPEVRQIWTHRIGNLALLPFRKNSQASNFDFERKKEEYFKKGRTVDFALTTEIVNWDHWTLEVIEERQKILIGRLAKAWSLRPGDRQ